MVQPYYASKILLGGTHRNLALPRPYVPTTNTLRHKQCDSQRLGQHNKASGFFDAYSFSSCCPSSLDMLPKKDKTRNSSGGRGSVEEPVKRRKTGSSSGLHSNIQGSNKLAGGPAGESGEENGEGPG